MPIIDVIMLGLAPATDPAVTYLITGGLDIGAVVEIWTPVSAQTGSWSTQSPQTGTWTTVSPNTGTWSNA